MAVSVIQPSIQRKSALIAGISLFIMVLVSFFSYGFAHESLVVQGDANATFQNIKSSPMLFKAEIFGWVIILITDIVVAWAFYLFLKPNNPYLSLLAAWFRLIYTAILGIALLNLIVVLLLSKSTEPLGLIPIDQLQAQMMLSLQAFESIWSIGLMIFGGHLMLVGYVAVQSENIPRVIGLLLLAASVGYMVINLSKLFFPQNIGLISTLTAIFQLPMIAGELGFGIWLLLKGGVASKRS
ncbi:DUF4386 domain-containing protein [Brevibacillus sp. DP1.3A]|uniref:DUF4386 domain-containing protein n=1 Tax=Brevibacillus sp. DP1.3A TaxID=2738867 RepID=UPI00156B4B97|nr:DUF4386 domain-containing protein [Brevibacillus sp. DP1.3A]UED73659.1 DUF4386 domain-containing protein [Brevibacillus sp. DP1.3A]